VLSLFRFIAKHIAYLYFLLYCGISILLMQLQRKETLDAIRERGLAMNASIAEQLSNFTAIFTLRQDNEQLLLQNARLFSQVMHQKQELSDAKAMQAASSEAPEWARQFKLARIVDRRFSATDNMLVIDAGSRHGITSDMTVLTPDGLVGRVIEVSENYAKILPVINKNFMVSVVSDSTRTLGLLSWQNGDERIAHMEHVPVSSTLKVGEQIATSDYSTFAIRGVPVGRVVRISKDKLFCNIDIRLAVDFSSLSYVLVSPAKPSREKIEIMNGDTGRKEQ
jgi:rod shape-determining protein MreC